jgi:hypothetical protein
MKKLLTLFCVLFSIFPSLFSQVKECDVVYLTNANIIKGVILEHKHDEFVKMNTSEGVYIFPTSDIIKIEKGNCDAVVIKTDSVLLKEILNSVLPEKKY